MLLKAEEMKTILCSSGCPVGPACQETTGFSKQPIRTRYLGHVTGYQPIREQYFLIRSVPTWFFSSFQLGVVPCVEVQGLFQEFTA